MDPDQNPVVRVVVLGGSAGSIDVLGTVLSGLPQQPGFAVLVITHLPSDTVSHLDDLLKKRTDLPVERLQHLTKIEHDHVYVLPEDACVQALDGHFRLTRRQPGPHLPLDFCLASMAQDPDVHAAVVVLSGSGRDGANGLADLRSAGGLVIAQAPNTAEHDGMPTAAINTGLVDQVLPPAEIAPALVRRFGDPSHDTDDGPMQTNADALETALAIVQQKTGVNLGYVKDVNLRRRFLRRVLLQKNRDVAAYLQLLRGDAQEAAALRDDVLIGVTAFFRDTEFVNVLRQTVIPKLLELRHDPIRVWVPACSTGEEVYTIAMLIRDALQAEGLSRRVQIFGTDINEASIETARAGRYSAASVENVPQPIRDTAFNATASGYLVSKDLREMCVFARHNLLTHAPFSGMGLISCRNMMIYLRKEAQQHVLEVLHYACRPDGLLILGRAEAASQADGFEHAGAPHLYRKLTSARRQRSLFPIDALRPWASEGSAPRPTQPPAPDLIAEAINRVALARYAPPGFVVDANGDVVQFRGDVAAFVAPATGEATLALPRLLHAELNVPVRTALIEAKRTGQPVRRERVQFMERRYVLEVLPVDTKEAILHFLVTLAPQLDEAGPTILLPSQPPRARMDELERTVTTLSDELEATQLQLKTLVIEFESANEELRTANEEMLSTNEELQSANEELQSAKQELESANQELVSLNEELKSRNDQLDVVNDDLSNLVEGIPLPVVLLDRQLKLRHASPPAAQLFGLSAEHIGQPLSAVSSRFSVGDLEQLVQAAVQGLTAIEHEYQDNEQRWWMVNVRAYRTADERIDGAVIAFQDIHQLKRAVDQAQHARGDAERANTAKDDFLGMVSHELRAPLNVISGWASVLRQAHERHALDEAATGRAIATILKHCQAQAQLIDDLLDVSRITSGHLALEMRPIDLAASARAVIEGLMPAAQAKQLTLVASGLQDVLRIQGDARRVQQVVSNLLGNALKFTPSGGRITLSLSRVGAMIELAVADTGIGVGPELLPHLFDRFTQSDISRTREYGGLGLGLSIVRHLVQAHGGTVAAHSDGEGRGTRLTVRFPAVDVVQELSPITAAASTGPVDLVGLQLLLVDDDPHALEALEQLMRMAGASVRTAGSVSDARDLLAQQRFDALVSDVAMPGTDGYALIRELREQEHRQRTGTNGAESALPTPHDRVTAIALSGLATLQDRDAAISAGFDDHLPKPVDVDRLMERLALARGR
ncbi:two-component system, chemotaxis family, CheB/CheR fusion protein [Roseateles sp. YR242]|uniref:CheR family methyltransferase n=1 Tax=Roseateles sp. YR242 TaxID=1855305 RepID=UPI0008D7DD8B|nr:CheR family methyltransferase [Roseateles sp. YR242]SEL84801.1 two-component system, chemotaxis family, CheB/CheR fusion protein [Roseateles sp. YR242]